MVGGSFFFLSLNSSFFMHVSKYLCTCNCACNLCNLQKQRKRLSLSDLHRLEQCLVGMSDGKRVTSDADGSMAFCAGESLLETPTRQQMGLFSVWFSLSWTLFLPGILPLLTKQDWVRFSFGPHMYWCTSHSRQTQAGWEIMSSEGQFGTNLEKKTTRNSLHWQLNKK